MNSRLPSNLSIQVTDHVIRKAESEFQKSKWRQQQKLEGLQRKSTRRNTPDNPELGGEQLKKWVVNLSKHKLTDPQLSVLAKGLNFSPSPNKIPYDDYIVATELACKKLPYNEATVLRSEIAQALRGSKPPKSNISKDERKAINDLKKNKEILILPADKGKATVLMDVDEYEQKVSNMLSDEKTYEVLKSDPTAKYKRKLVAMLKKLKKDNKITRSQYDLLYPTAENVPRIYGTPKIHKAGNKVRPIVDYTATISYQTSRALADILGPLVGTTEHHVLNSKHLADTLSEVMIDDGDIFNSHDVVSLFTNVPVDEALQVIKSKLEQDKDLHKRTNLKVDDIIELLQFVMTTTYFLFRGKIYQQRFGTAMGSPVSPVIANFYMEFLEQKAIATAPIEVKPKLWRRYVDDILEIVKSDQVDNLTEHLNSVDPTGSIQFTHEQEVDGKIPFLDTLIIKKPDGTIKLLIYRKATHTDQYLNFNSHHPVHHKLGVIRTLFDRMNTIITEKDDIKLEEDKIKSALSLCGYPAWTFKKVKEQIKNKPAKKPPKKKETDQKSRGLVVIPYVQGLSERSSRIFRKHGIATAMRPNTTLRKLLVHPKDKREPSVTTDVVYDIPCINCDTTYVGETSRLLKTRVEEHRVETIKITTTKKNYTRQNKKLSESEYSKSGIADHAAQKNHIIDWTNPKILCKESDYRSRQIRESIWIRRKSPNVMNRDEGNHILSHVYDPLITATAPSTGQRKF